MPPTFPFWVETAGLWIDAAGVLVIIGGIVLSLARFLLRRQVADPYRALRQDLGRTILLGLEFLVAADIIRTVAVTPSLQNVTVLAFIVLIRTFLSLALEVELEGKWPWHRQV